MRQAEAEIDRRAGEDKDRKEDKLRFYLNDRVRHRPRRSACQR